MPSCVSKGKPVRFGVLISGRGSNLQALIEECRDHAHAAQIVQVISDRPNAPGLTLAIQAGIPTQVVPRKPHHSATTFEQVINTALCDAQVDMVLLAGFMRILSPWFVERWHDRLVNIHPSLLPAFRGLHSHADALAAGVRWSGCTVHFVRSAVDQGPIIVQAVVPVAPDDTESTLAARILPYEHRCYRLALRLLATKRVQIKDERVLISDFPATYTQGWLHPDEQ